jgi:hypothetical protein
LHGTRTFRDVLHQHIFGTGDYRREKNVTPQMKFIPELAFMTREEQEGMLAVLGWQIDWGASKTAKCDHARKGVSRYESYWPGQSTTCIVCGSVNFVCGAHARCGNSFPHLDGPCWNHVQAPIDPLRAAIVEWLVMQCNSSLEFRKVLVDAALRQLQQQRELSGSERAEVMANVKALENQERNLRRSIGIAGKVSYEDLTTLVEDLASVTKQLRGVRDQLKSIVESSDPVEQLAGDEIVAHLPSVLDHLLRSSFEMAEVVRGFVPQCVIVPMQSYDTGQVYPRAKLWLRGNMQNYDDLSELVVDLFKAPLHIRIMSEAVRLRGEVPPQTLKQIGAQLGVSYMTVKRALGYARLMAQMGATEPFRELLEKPTNASRWRDAS